MNDLATAWRGSSAGELCWLTADGPAAVPVVPLFVDQPCVALPLAHLPEIDSLPDRAAFCVSAPTGPEGPTLVATGTISVSLDPRGTEFGGDLVEQEVLKHPPSRLRVGSLMARKENWWWMARALVRLTGVDGVRGLPARTRAEDAVLVRERDSDVRVDVVTARDWTAGPGRDVELWPRDGGDLAGRDERALVMGHHASPDFERWERWTRTGTLVGQTLRVTGADGGPDPDPRPYRLLERLRNHREVERACRAGVAAVERRLGR
ncbi:MULTISPECIES: hypothetical protein [unclassified Nocardiopsis]|uniref:hypothetical protein n=1 Tax=unclassified Nocardiopsis TaxID=2649073 RepID=UPI001F5B95DB|nr:hypothetical protein [Nocardiopsis sp. TSRI0078]